MSGEKTSENVTAASVGSDSRVLLRGRTAKDYAALSRRHRELYFDLAERDRMLNETRWQLERVIEDAAQEIAERAWRELQSGLYHLTVEEVREIMRRHASLPSERQPQENDKAEPHGGGAGHAT